MPFDRRWQPSGFSSSEYFPPGTKWLLIVNIAIFFLTALGDSLGLRAPLRMLALVPEAVLHHFALWQLVTYMFLHGGFSHILFNMFGLWMCGSMLERGWGTRFFLRYYFVCGIGAGLCDVILSAAFSHWGTATLGASGAVYGLLLAIGVLYPNQIFYMYFLFPLKAKYLVMIYGGMAFLGALQVNTGVSNVAHLGGMLAGFLFLKTRFVRVDWGWFRREYQNWKRQRAKKKFQVYMRKHGSNRGPWVN
jgi:membrane associated rhomboid family serine protease